MTSESKSGIERPSKDGVSIREEVKFVMVFGSNTAGRHGAGAALYAQKYRGAVYGRGVGRQGNSYAIPTKDRNIKTLPLEKVAGYVTGFITYAVQHPEENFQISAVGCGLAGFTHKQMAPLFAEAPENCWFDTCWKPLLGDSKRFWGTFDGRDYSYTPEFISTQETAPNC